MSFFDPKWIFSEVKLYHQYLNPLLLAETFCFALCIIHFALPWNPVVLPHPASQARHPSPNAAFAPLSRNQKYLHISRRCMILKPRSFAGVYPERTK